MLEWNHEKAEGNEKFLNFYTACSHSIIQAFEIYTLAFHYFCCKSARNAAAIHGVYI
jgi:hypothetical protein